MTDSHVTTLSVAQAALSLCTACTRGGQHTFICGCLLSRVNLINSTDLTAVIIFILMDDMNAKNIRLSTTIKSTSSYRSQLSSSIYRQAYDKRVNTVVFLQCSSCMHAYSSKQNKLANKRKLATVDGRLSEKKTRRQDRNNVHDRTSSNKIIVIRTYMYFH